MSCRSRPDAIPGGWHSRRMASKLRKSTNSTQRWEIVRWRVCRRTTEHPICLANVSMKERNGKAWREG